MEFRTRIEGLLLGKKTEIKKILGKNNVALEDMFTNLYEHISNKEVLEDKIYSDEILNHGTMKHKMLM